MLDGNLPGSLLYLEVSVMIRSLPKNINRYYRQNT